MEIRSPEDTLKQYISKMNAWEIWAKQNDPKEPAEEEWQSFKKACEAKLDTIFDEFCTSRKRVFRRQCDFRDPPEYQPGLEDIIEVNVLSSTREEIITQEKFGFKNKNKYVLLKEKGKWLLDNKQWFDDINNQWKKGLL